jgi:hypothetical protein
MAAIERPELFLVRPNIGQPLLLLRGQLDETFRLTLAGKTDRMPDHFACLTLLQDAFALQGTGAPRVELRLW